MRPAWRLAINSLSERRSRTALLIATVALSAALIAAVACAMASVHQGIRTRVFQTVGAADLRVVHVGRKSFDRTVLENVEQWPEVALAIGRGQEALSLKNPRTGKEDTVNGYGVMPDREYRIRPQQMEAGRPVQNPGEIAIDTLLAQNLEAHVGDTLDVVRFGEPIRLSVIGIVKQPPFGMLVRPEAYVTIEQLGQIVDRRNRVYEIDILLKPDPQPRRAANTPAWPETVAAAHAKDVPRGLVVRVAAKITSGVNKNLESNQIGMVIASVLAFLSAAFIIMTGLTTNVTERQRELAVLRCIGGTKAQLAEAQLAVGLVVGGLGAIVGIPIGIAGAAAIVALFPEQLPGGFAMSWLGVALALLGSTLAGIAGAAWPAWTASRTSPLQALAVRAQPAKRRNIVIAGAIGLALVAVHIAILSLPTDSQVIFWGDLTTGMPAMFSGYFLLSVPFVILVTFLFGGLIGRLMGLPRGLLSRTVYATPWRHGFTAGAMMVGLALLIAIWTNGHAIMRDWLDQLEFPDAFVNGRNLTEETQHKIEQIPGVTGTCAITIENVKTDAFGIRAMDNTKTSFIAFEPEPFFAMTRLTWVQPRTGPEIQAAKARLSEGGAVIVAREFLVTKGLGVGKTITLYHDDKPYTFEIVGVVDSPGLDIVSKFFDIGDEYLDQAVNSVFGARRDLKEKFGNDGIQLIQIGIAPDVDDKPILRQVRGLVDVGVISAGSGREIKDEIRGVLGGSLFVFSVVAIVAMLVSCFGVANLIVAGIQARQFEFGVLRAIGAQRGLLARLVLGEAVIIALTACFLGTIMGVQSSWAGQRMYEVLLGLLLRLRIPVAPVAVGWAILTAITLAAALPAVIRLTKRQPRELLGAMKG